MLVVDGEAHGGAHRGVHARPRPLVITGRLCDEAPICRIALTYEQATEWKDRPPTMSGAV
jgi:Asp-tRNA(Asn)/Glu-tRNA(Gln) amidotransferase A subunit family amidase